MGRTIRDLPHALADDGGLAGSLRGSRPAVFLDYDGVLTPIVERPEDAVLSESMRNTVRDLAARCPVCVVSGRDRAVVQQLMGIDDLIVAGDHGFDIWIPRKGVIIPEAVTASAELIRNVIEQVRAEVSIPGVVVEAKRASVALHYRMAGAEARERVGAAVRGLLSQHAKRLKVTPGKMVFEVQPNIEWDKGKAVLYLIKALGLERDDTLAFYLGDDVTDEDAFRALSGWGVGIMVGRADDPEVADRQTAAAYALASTDEVQRFLTVLAC